MNPKSSPSCWIHSLHNSSMLPPSPFGIFTATNPQFLLAYGSLLLLHKKNIEPSSRAICHRICPLVSLWNLLSLLLVDSLRLCPHGFSRVVLSDASTCPTLVSSSSVGISIGPFTPFFLHQSLWLLSFHGPIVFCLATHLSQRPLPSVYSQPKLRR